MPLNLRSVSSFVTLHPQILGIPQRHEVSNKSPLDFANALATVMLRQWYHIKDALTGSPWCFVPW